MQFFVQLNPQVSIDVPAADLLPVLVEQVRLAHELGFAGFSAGEHYNIPGLQRLHQVPLLARLTAEAPGLAVGTAITLLGLRHPVEVAAELASLDVISGGRSFAGFGLGYRQQELDAFGLDRAARLRRFVEGVEIVRRLWSGDHVSVQGRAYRLEDVTIDPKPIQPLPPIWLAANSDRGVERAATSSDGWFIGPHSAIDELRGQVDLCRTAWRRAGKDGEPALPIIREAFVAPTHEQAIARAREPLERLYGDLYVRWGQNEAMRDPDELRWDFDRLARDRFILGSPDECIEQVRRYRDELGVDRLFVRFDWPSGVGQPEVLGAMRLFGREVMPHV